MARRNPIAIAYRIPIVEILIFGSSDLRKRGLQCFSNFTPGRKGRQDFLLGKRSPLSNAVNLCSRDRAMWPVYSVVKPSSNHGIHRKPLEALKDKFKLTHEL